MAIEPTEYPPTPPLPERRMIDPRPLCVICSQPWVPAEGVDATTTSCDDCRAPTPPEPPLEVCAGCGERYAPSMAATEHENCRRAFDLGGKSREDTIVKLRADLNKQAQERIEIEDALARNETELARLRLLVSEPSDEKLEGIRSHAFDALEHFFYALKDFREGVESNKYYRLADPAERLLRSVDALMFLDERTRPALDELRPVLESLGEIERLGWFRERYGQGRLEAVRVFLALDVLRRTIGLKARAAGGDD